MTATFTNTSIPGIPPATDYLWDFGDGETSTEFEPTHVYTQAGDYQVTLSVENKCGEAVVTDTVTVTAPCEPVDGLSFTWSPEAPLVNETVSFSATAPLTGTPPFTVTWNFGDGSPGESGVDLTYVTHVYTQGGDYEVTLSAENPCGEAVVTDTVMVETEAPPTYYIYLPLVRK
jgi:PKD repeat protein